MLIKWCNPLTGWQSRCEEETEKEKDIFIKKRFDNAIITGL
jgi:hypothetical protein